MFDPVRDAVLQSPAGQSAPLPSPLSETPSASPTSSRRATDLAVLLNAPLPPRRPSDLAAILLPPSLSRAAPADSPIDLTTPTTTMPTKPRLAYNPTKRISKPDSVLHPLSDAERALFTNTQRNPLRAHIQTQSDRKRKSDDRGDPSLVRGFNGAYPNGGRGQPPRKRFRDQDAGLVINHYNARPDVGVRQRQHSPIIGLKNFNNWVKSVLIARFAHPALHSTNTNPRQSTSSPSASTLATPMSAEKTDSKPGGKQGKGGGNGAGAQNVGKVLDMGCGKGGDLNKWQKAKVREYHGLDVASISIEQARSRYLQNANTHHNQANFSANFYTLDCYTLPLTSAIPPDALPPRASPFDVVSMQFCMHYAFESVDKVRIMLENVTKWLRVGGVFVGTVPNDELLLSRLDEMSPDTPDDELTFGNEVYRVRFDAAQKVSRPTFGHRYWFFLTDAVEDVPEYIVRWDNFVKMAEEYDLHLLYHAEFHDVYVEHHTHPEYGPLLQRMRVVDENGESHMNEDQWEAANIYVAFAFEKRQGPGQI